MFFRHATSRYSSCACRSSVRPGLAGGLCAHQNRSGPIGYRSVTGYTAIVILHRYLVRLPNNYGASSSMSFISPWPWLLAGYAHVETVEKASGQVIETILEGRFNPGFKKPGARQGLYIGLIRLRRINPPGGQARRRRVKLLDLSFEGMRLWLVA